MKNDGDESQGTLINDFKDIKFDDNDVLGTPLENINVYKALGISEGKYNKKIIRMKHASENQNDKSDEKIFSENSELKATLEEKIKEMNKLLRSNKEESKKDELVKKIALAQAFVNVATENFNKFASYNEKVGNDLYPSKITRTELAYAEAASAGKNIGKAAGGIAGAVASVAKGVGHLGVSALKNTNRLTRAGGRVASGGVAIPTYEGLKRLGMGATTFVGLVAAEALIGAKVMTLDASRLLFQKGGAGASTIPSLLRFVPKWTFRLTKDGAIKAGRDTNRILGVPERAYYRFREAISENTLNGMIREAVDGLDLGLKGQKSRDAKKKLYASIIEARKSSFANLNAAVNGKEFDRDNKFYSDAALKLLKEQLENTAKNNKEFDKNIEAIMKQAEKADAWIGEQVDSFAKNAIRNEGKDDKGKEGAGSRAKDTKDIRDEYDSKYGIKAVFKKSNEALEKRIGADHALKHSKEMASEMYGKFKKRNQDGLKSSKNVIKNVAYPLVLARDEFTRVLDLVKKVDDSHKELFYEPFEMPGKDIDKLSTKEKVSLAQELKEHLKNAVKDNKVPKELLGPVKYELGIAKAMSQAVSIAADIFSLQGPVRGIKGLLKGNATKTLTKENLDAHNKASKTLKESDAGTPSLASSQSGSLRDELESIKSEGVTTRAIAATKKDTLSNKSSSSRSGSSRSGSSSFGGR